MYAKYGDYSHAEGEVSFRHSIAAKMDSGGVPYAYTETYQLSGELFATTQAAITTAITALQAAYSRQFQDFVFYDNSGNETPHRLKNSETLGGVRVIEKPSFPDSRGAEYSTFRSYSIVLQADVPITASQGNRSISEWSESLTFIGTGGPRVVWQPMITGPPIRQQVSELTTIKAIQQGSAVAFNDYVWAPPLFAIEFEHEDQRVNGKSDPQFMGNGTFRYYPSNWAYFYEFNNPQTGNPTGRPT